MSIKAVRVSKTSFKRWDLHGPVDQALKTSTQAEAVKCIPIHLEDVHGEPVDLELWANSEPGVPGDDEPNPHGQLILQQIELRKQGITVQEVIEGGYGLPELFVINGVAILTGPGGTDIPEAHLECTLGALLGHHPQG